MENKWSDVITIPAYLVQGIGDAGMVEYVAPEGEDKDDLRVSIELSGGMIVVLPISSRIVIDKQGNFIIQRS